MLKDMLLFLVAAVAAAVGLMVLRGGRRVQSRGEKLMQAARRRGYTAQAVLVHSEDLKKAQYVGDHLDTNRQAYLWISRATYEYTVDGRTYRITQDLKNVPARTITVYFPSGDPDRAFLEGCAPGGKTSKGLTLGLLAAAFILYQLLRMIF